MTNFQAVDPLLDPRQGRVVPQSQGRRGRRQQDPQVPQKGQVPKGQELQPHPAQDQLQRPVGGGRGGCRRGRHTRFDHYQIFN